MPTTPWKISPTVRRVEKGLALQHPTHVELSTGGIEGDRALFLVDETGVLIGCTELGDLMRRQANDDPTTRVLEVPGPDGVLRSAPVERGETLITDFYGLRSGTGTTSLCPCSYTSAMSLPSSTNTGLLVQMKCMAWEGADAPCPRGRTSRGA